MTYDNRDGAFLPSSGFSGVWKVLRMHCFGVGKTLECYIFGNKTAKF